jgi:FkbM family methyltransferase
LTEQLGRIYPWQHVRAFVKQQLKYLRNTQPFNWVATTVMRPILRITGVEGAMVTKHLHRHGTVKARLPNGRTLRLWSQGDDFVSNQIFWNGWNAYETETLSLFFELATRAEVILDVGAHVGVFSLVAAHANPGARVFAFEPVAPTYQRLQSNVALNQLKNVRCFQSALSDKDGTAQFFHQPGMTFTASLSREFMHWQKTWSSSMVTVITGDKFVEENNLPRVDLMKIDTESTEPQVLAGILKTIERHRPNIICEVLPGLTERSIENLLGPLGYSFYHITDNGLVRREKITGDLKFRNYLLSPATDDSRIFVKND